MINSVSLQQPNFGTGFFSGFARWCEQQVARPGAAFAAIAFVALWLITGPLYGWSNTWQLVINTSSSVVTLVMVFVIQHTQRRDTQAIQLKLDELIRVNSEARNELISLEAKPETAVEEVKSAFEEIREAVEEEASRHDAE